MIAVGALLTFLGFHNELSARCRRDLISTLTYTRCVFAGKTMADTIPLVALIVAACSMLVSVTQLVITFVKAMYDREKYFQDLLKDWDQEYKTDIAPLTLVLKQYRDDHASRLVEDSSAISPPLEVTMALYRTGDFWRRILHICSTYHQLYKVRCKSVKMNVVSN